MKGCDLKSFGETLRHTLEWAMKKDSRVFVMGLGVDDHKGIFGSTKGLVDKFGPKRVFDTPISEAAMTGVAIGAAVAGLKPVHVHIRNDFLYLAMDQLFNMAAKWSYMFGGQMSVPMVVRCIVGRSWGQGAQHSQCLPSFFMHVPGIKIVMPTTARDAQGLLLSALNDKNPVVIIEHRLLYDIKDWVPKNPVPIPLGKAFVRRRGRDVTLVTNSYMVVESLKAAEFLSTHGIEVEIVDPVSLVPLDEKTIVNSVKKTKRLLAIDTSWLNCGVSAEVVARVAKSVPTVQLPIRRLGWPATPCPVSQNLEKEFYPSARVIAEEIFSMLGRPFPRVHVENVPITFKGPF